MGVADPLHLRGVDLGAEAVHALEHPGAMDAQHLGVGQVGRYLPRRGTEPLEAGQPAPAAEGAQLTVVTPDGKNAPGGGVQTVVPHTVSDGGVYPTTAPHCPGSELTVISCGQVSAQGGPVDTTTSVRLVALKPG